MQCEYLSNQLSLAYSMKIIAGILAIVLFSLSVTPCADVSVHCEKDATEASHSHDHDHSEEGEDSCTPFCICNCCGTSFTFVDLESNADEMVILPISGIYHFIMDYSYDHFSSVFIPPSIS
jgi:hypothetical protein